VPKDLKIRLRDQSPKSHDETASKASPFRLAIVLSFPKASDGGFDTITRWITVADQVSCLSGYAQSPVPVPKTGQ